MNKKRKACKYLGEAIATADKAGEKDLAEALAAVQAAHCDTVTADSGGTPHPPPPGPS